MSLTKHENQPLTALSLTAFCKATADNLRLNVLRALKNESFGVTELCQIFSVAQPGMSHHLKALLAAGLVATRREGNTIFYRRAIINKSCPLARLTTELYATIDDLAMEEEAAKHMQKVHAERAQRSRAFFDKTTEKFSENQELIADFDQYADPVLDLISNEDLSRDSDVLEVGPGNGELLKELSSRFRRVVAMDNSAPMLAWVQSQLGENRPENIEFKHDDLEHGTQHGEDYHLVVLNMVTHHLASPAVAFSSARQLLRPGGRLLIVDLCPHDQDWTRDACGDLWLGFEPEDLDKWALEHKLLSGQSLYLGLKNGFQVQARLYHKPTIT